MLYSFEYGKPLNTCANTCWSLKRRGILGKTNVNEGAVSLYRSVPAQNTKTQSVHV
jgi:hypothetical protein